VVKLKPEDIENERKLIHIKGAKGRKDRYTMLSEVALETIRSYLKEYGQSKWLFPSHDKEKHITPRTVGKIFSTACKKANTKKNVTVHSLRHSFATHPGWKAVRTCGISRSCLGIKVQRRQRYIRM
jgi:site-specific recombinase XerD